MPVTYDETPLGVSWTESGGMQRAAHALKTPDGVWLIDPFEDAGALERAAALGAPAGVVQLLDRHNRDAAPIAARLGVPHLRLPTAIPGSPFEPVRVLDLPRWREVALWWPGERVLVVAEAIGTNELFAVGDARAGVHALLRLTPPGALKDFAPEHLLVGHGPPLLDGAGEPVRAAIAGSRREIPRWLVGLPGARRRT
jgi:hypothetical protein